jgi:hypothetical protein
LLGRPAIPDQLRAGCDEAEGADLDGESCFSKLKQFRAVATCDDKRDRIYQGTIDVASIRIWLRDPVT